MNEQSVVLSRMVDDLRTMRKPVTPKNPQNPLYQKYCLAISAIEFILNNEPSAES